mgnify:CR=1 FL=1
MRFALSHIDNLATWSPITTSVARGRHGNLSLATKHKVGNYTDHNGVQPAHHTVDTMTIHHDSGTCCGGTCCDAGQPAATTQMGMDTVIYKLTKDGAPVSSGEFRAAALGDEAGSMQGAELLTDTDGTEFVARYYERMPHGDGILPDNDLALSATALDPVAACPLFFSNLVESGGDLPDGAVPVLQGASHRYYHGFRGQESWPIGGEDVPNALVAPTFSQLGSLGGEVQSTAIVRAAGTVDAFPYDVVMLSSRNDVVPVDACPELEEVLPFIWSEYAPLGWTSGDDVGDES